MPDDRTHEALSRTSRLINQQFFAAGLDERAISNILPRMTARIACDAPNSATPNGQNVVVTLALLLARMGLSVELDVPDVALCAPQPPLRGERVRSALVEIGDDLVPRAKIREHVGVPFVTFVVGDTPSRVGSQALRLSGDEWSFEIACANSSGGTPWGDGLPFGALACATAAAAEALRAAVPLVADELGATLVADAHRLAVGRTIALDLRSFVPAFPSGPLDLGRVDAISGGAITNAAFYVLQRTPSFSAAVRVIETEDFELSNVNRYMLTRRSHDGLAKTAILELSSFPGLDVVGLPLRFEQETIPDIGPLADRVLVGVDHIPSRWLVQREAPAWLGVGSTQSFDALVSAHRPGEPCAGCLHMRNVDTDEIVPTISFVSFWAGLLLTLELLSDATGRPRCDQSLFCSAFGYNGPHLMRLPVAPQPKCPVRCTASRRTAC